MTSGRRPELDGGTPPQDPGARVVCHLDRLLEARALTLVELSERAGITAVNLSVLTTAPGPSASPPSSPSAEPWTAASETSSRSFRTLLRNRVLHDGDPG